ncbi:hypothetical protein L7F22_058474 [Adiantum nelumboides]|nr:hypothetical protein [Adiantum nelumboides]
MVMANGVKFTIHNVRHIPALTRNFILVERLDDLGYKVTFHQQSWRIAKGHLILAHGSKVGTLYSLYVSNRNSVLSVIKLPTVALWHSRLGHMSKKGMETLSRLGYLPSLSFFDFPFCEHCQYAHSKQESIWTAMNHAHGMSIANLGDYTSVYQDEDIVRALKDGFHEAKRICEMLGMQDDAWCHDLWEEKDLMDLFEARNAEDSSIHEDADENLLSMIEDNNMEGISSDDEEATSVEPTTKTTVQEHAVIVAATSAEVTAKLERKATMVEEHKTTSSSSIAEEHNAATVEAANIYKLEEATPDIDGDNLKLSSFILAGFKMRKSRSRPTHNASDLVHLPKTRSGSK